jgi:hypothetical protein
VAFEPGLRAFLAFRVSYHPQSIPDAYLFLKELRARYGRKPIWSDGGAWYPERAGGPRSSITSTGRS